MHELCIVYTSMEARIMNELDIFDSSRAIARLLKLLHDEDRDGLTTLNMYNLMNKRYGVARTAVDSSLEAAIDLRLLDRYKSAQLTVNMLTAKGMAAAAKVKELENILTNDSL